MRSCWAAATSPADPLFAAHKKRAPKKQRPLRLARPRVFRREQHLGSRRRVLQDGRDASLHRRGPQLPQLVARAEKHLRRAPRPARIFHGLVRFGHPGRRGRPKPQGKRAPHARPFVSRVSGSSAWHRLRALHLARNRGRRSGNSRPRAPLALVQRVPGARLLSVHGAPGRRRAGRADDQQHPAIRYPTVRKPEPSDGQEAEEVARGHRGKRSLRPFFLRAD